MVIEPEPQGVIVKDACTPYSAGRSTQKINIDVTNAAGRVAHTRYKERERAYGVIGQRRRRGLKPIRLYAALCV
jgi:hypothetical protein